MPTQHRDRVFVSYSHKDKEWLEKFSAVLAPDIRNERVDFWDDRELQPGDPWYAKILDGIHTARVAVLLVSPNFLASRFIMEEEVPRILAARDDGLTIVWVPLFGTFYGPNAPSEIKPITEVQAAFDAGKPLADHDPASQTAHLLKLCRHIQRLISHPRVPRSMPPFSSLGELFKGRDDVIEKLDSNLRQHGAETIFQPVAIQGLSGVGKTRLALEYAWRHPNDFAAYLFVSANTPYDLDRNLAGLCRPDRLDLAESQSLSQPEQRDAVIRWLQQNPGWLLILDNVDTDEGMRAVKALIANLRGGHILITSRITMWGRGVHALKLDVLKMSAAESNLISTAQTWRKLLPDDPEHARIVAERLGCLPLALTHANAYMHNHHKGFAAYLEAFDKHFDQLLAYHDHDEIEYETELQNERKESETPEARTTREHLLKTVATTFFLSFSRLTPEAKAILQAAAFLAPDPIPVAMFEICPNEVATLANLWCEEAGESRRGQNVADALAALSRYSLISRAEGVFEVHRMEQVVLRNRVPVNRKSRWVESTRAVLSKYAPDETAESPRTWAVWDKLRPHAEALVRFYREDTSVSPHLELMSSLGSLYYGKGLYSLGLSIDEESVKIAERTEGLESQAVADRLLSYGETLRVLNRDKDALTAFQTSQGIRQTLDGAYSSRVATVLNYVGLVQDSLGEQKEAELSFRRAIEIYESLSEDRDNGEFMKPLVNLAGLVWRNGNIIEAEMLLSKAVKFTVEDHSGKLKPQTTIICCNSLARLLAEKGDIIESDRLFALAVERALVFPEQHPFRQAVVEGYAQSLRVTHRLAKAKEVIANLVIKGDSGVVVESPEVKSDHRIGSKLRIIEAVVEINDAPESNDAKAAFDPVIVEECAQCERKPWHPLLIKAIKINDLKDLGFDFIFDTGTDGDLTGKSQQQARTLMEYFLTAIAVGESNQWATSNGVMPSELRGTRLGSELVSQGQKLSRLLACACGTGSASGDAFRERIGFTGNWVAAKAPSIRIDLWVSPAPSKVFSGEFDGELLARFGTSGDSRAFVIEAPIDVFWECHVEGAQIKSGELDEAAGDSVNNAFESLILPIIKRSLAEGKLLASIRQINHCMILALWFKEQYKYHPNVAKFLETGNPSQLSPTIRKISSVPEKAGDEATEIPLWAGEADRNRAVELNNKGLELRKLGRFDEAESLARESLRIDESLNEYDAPIIAHRLNNLSVTLIMRGCLAEAQQTLLRAWSIKLATGHDITSTRVLFVRIVVDLLEHNNGKMFIGLLKTLLSGESLKDYANVMQIWDIDYFIEHLRAQLPPGSADFLTTLSAVLNDRTKLPDLERIAEWKNQPPIPLNTSWPRTS